MLIGSFDIINGDSLEYDELISYLSQVVLTRIDEEIKEKQLDINKIKLSISKIKEKTNQLKNDYNSLQSRMAIEKQKERVLSLITTLNKEGVVRGQNRVKIINLLNSFNKMSFFDLREVEEKLSLLRK